MPAASVPEVIPQRYEASVPLDRLTPHPANPNEADLGLLCDLVDANGFAGAVLAQESSGILIDGEHRWRTAQEKGMTGLPVLWLDVDDDARDRLLASLNESTRRGRNDEAKLAALLTGLAQAPRGLEGTGFDGDDLDALIAGLGGQGGGRPLDGDPDDVPEPPAEPVSVPGDLWHLGPRRLLCGNAQTPESLDRLLAGDLVSCVLTDPPYGMNLDTDYSKMPGGNARSQMHRQPKKYKQVEGDDEPFDASFLRLYFNSVKEQFWFGADYYRRTLSEQDTDGSWLVWDKRQESQDDVIGSGFETCWSSSPHQRRVLRHYWCGAFGSPEARNRYHPTQKPVSLLADILTRWAPADAIVCDPFGGSGSTLLACHQTGRAARLVELDPAYCDVICKRWEQRTSIKPERVLPDGTTEPVTFTGDQP